MTCLPRTTFHFLHFGKLSWALVSLSSSNKGDFHSKGYYCLYEFDLCSINSPVLCEPARILFEKLFDVNIGSVFAVVFLDLLIDRIRGQ